MSSTAGTALKSASLIPSRTPIRPSLLKRWLSLGESNAVQRWEIQLKLCAVQASRKLPAQIRQVREVTAVDHPHDLGPRVVRLNRAMVSQEEGLAVEAKRLHADRACAVQLLTPQILLNQAKVEWEAQLKETQVDDFVRLQKCEKVVSRLIELTEMLHPDDPVPVISHWVTLRVTDLRAQRRLCHARSESPRT